MPSIVSCLPRYLSNAKDSQEEKVKTRPSSFAQCCLTRKKKNRGIEEQEVSVLWVVISECAT